MTWKFTADIPDAFFTDVVKVAWRLGMKGHELDLVRPLMNESGLSFKAFNANGGASGIFQAMPFVLRGLGFTGAGAYHETPGAYASARAAGDQVAMKALNLQLAAAFRGLDADQQLPWLERYYAPHAADLVNATSVYCVTFCPAWAMHAAEPGFIICAADGRHDGHGIDEATSKIWYAANRGLDKNGDGAVTMSDLTAAIHDADFGARWDEICVRHLTALAELHAADVANEAPMPAPLVGAAAPPVWDTIPAPPPYMA
jgi:hypothetical protein